MDQEKIIIELPKTPLSLEDGLRATGRSLYGRLDLKESFTALGSGSEITFFRFCHHISDDDLEKEYEQMGLVPADLYSLMLVNLQNPIFADFHPNGIHVKDKDGIWIQAVFITWDGMRDFFIRRTRAGWNKYFWLAGVPATA